MDVNKGDGEHMSIRSRVVGRELTAKTKEALLAHRVFSAIPLREMFTSISGLLVTDGVPGPTTTHVDHANMFSQGGPDSDDSGGNDDEFILGMTFHERVSCPRSNENSP